MAKASDALFQELFLFSLQTECRRLIRGREFFLDSRMLKKFVQQGRRRIEIGGVPSGYVEDFDEPRTKLADFFSIRLACDSGQNGG